MIEAPVAPTQVDDAGTHPSASDLVKALNHPSRRSILRYLLSRGPASSRDVQRGTPGLGGNRINFHFKILVTTGAITRRKRQAGYRESIYSLTEAARARWFLTVLNLTAAED